MARVLTWFFRQISWASSIHVKGFFPVYQVRVLPRGQYPLGWVLCTWEIPTSVGCFPVAIPTQVRVPETNRVHGCTDSFWCIGILQWWQKRLLSTFRTPFRVPVVSPRGAYSPLVTSTELLTQPYESGLGWWKRTRWYQRVLSTQWQINPPYFTWTMAWYHLPIRCGSCDCLVWW